MIRKTLKTPFLKIDLETNDRSILDLLLKTVDFTGKAASKSISLSFRVMLENKVPLSDNFYNYTHLPPKDGETVSYMNARLVTVSVNEKNSMVNANVYDMDKVHHPRIAQTVFLDPLTQLLDAHGYRFLHCGLAIKKDRCIMVCGPSGSGKSTVSILLALCGHELLTDDKCFFKENGESYTFLTLQQKIGVQPHLWKNFPALRKFKAQLDYDGKRKRIAADSFIRTSGKKQDFIPGALFFPKYQSGIVPHFKPISPQSALQQILIDPGNTYNAGRSKASASQNLFSMHSLTRKIPAFQIFYNDEQITKIPDVIAPLLKQYLR